MDYNRIELLLHKYLGGNSTIAEENELSFFFTTNKEIPDKLLFARDIFNYLSKEKLNKRTRINKYKKRANKKRFYYLTGIAVSLLLGLFLTFSTNKDKNEVIYAFIDGKAITDISIAKKYTMQIILSTSEKIDMGTKSLYYACQFTDPISLINN